MAKEKKPNYEGDDNRRRFKVPEGGKRETWSEDDRKDFLDKCEKLRPFVDHLTTKVPEKKKSRWDLPVVG